MRFLLMIGMITFLLHIAHAECVRADGAHNHPGRKGKVKNASVDSHLTPSTGMMKIFSPREITPST
jgi:hypothetical protein